jgi:hypothetical protein
MTNHSCARYAAAVSVAILGWAIAVAAQTTAADPWSRVPPATTNCYVNDGFDDKIDKAVAALDADISRQTELNAKIKEQFQAIDGMEKARRMQAWMMKNPQEAMKMMQGLQTAGATINSQITASSTNGPRLDQEFKDHAANFRAAVDNALKPIEAKMAELTRTKGIQAEGGVTFAPADQAQYAVLIKQKNVAYEKVCGSFFGPTTIFATWLSGYKTHVISDVIAPQETSDAAMVSQMAIMDSPTGGYRSTAKLEGVRDYLRRVRAAYDLRWGAPLRDN